MAKDINRSAYTQRILEIVSSIRKQNQDIDKVGLRVIVADVMSYLLLMTKVHVNVLQNLSRKIVLFVEFFIFITFCFIVIALICHVVRA